MKNFIKNGNTMTFTAGADLSSGQGLKIGQVFGVVAGDVANGAEGELHLTGVYELPLAAVEVTLGALLYWDDTAKKLTTEAEENMLVGAAMAAAADSDGVVIVRLNGIALADEPAEEVT